MQQTSHYQLNQWDAEDRIQRTDFNSDNAKVDAVLAEQAADLSAQAVKLAKCGNCQIYTTSYTGNGSYDASSPNSITFPQYPLFVVIIDNLDGSMMLAVQGATTTYARASGAGFVTVSWSANTMSWYASSNSTQMNENGHTFTVVAMMAVDALMLKARPPEIPGALLLRNSDQVLI